MENTTKNILIGSGIGLVCGATLGVLFAPSKGEDTRSAIKEKFNHMKENISEIDPKGMLNQLQAKVESKFKEEKSKTKDELLAEIEKLESAIEKA